MADRYWVGGTANWDGTAGTKWSTTSGGAGGASVPTSADDVFFTNLSTGTCTVTATANCKSLNFTGFTGGFAGTLFNINVYGSVTLVAAMSFTYSAIFIIRGNGTFTSAGKTVGSLRIGVFNAFENPVVTLGDALTLSGGGGSGSLDFNEGTFDTANYNITATSVVASGGSITVNLGSSTVTVTNTTGTALNFAAAGLTLNAGTSAIVFTGSGVNCVGGLITNTIRQGVSFYNVSFTSTATNTHNVQGINTFNNLTVTAPASAGVRQITFDARQTINGTLSTTGTAGNRRVWFRGLTYGIAQTLTINSAPSLTDADFRDIYVIGTAAPISGTRIGDLRGCRGITFDTPKNCYRIGSGDWSENQWSNTSGGSVSTDNFPLAQDTAIINQSSTSPLTLNTVITYTGAVDFSARTSAFTFNTSNSWTFYGSLTLGSGVTTSGTSTQTFSGRNTQVITSAGKTLTFPITIDSYGGSVELADALNIGSNTLTVTNGTFDSKNYNVTASVLSSGNNNVRTITLGSSTVTLNANSPISFTETNLTFNAGTSTITTSSTGGSFTGEGKTFYNVTYTSSSIGTINFTSSNGSTFNNLTITARSSAGITSVTTSGPLTITGTLTVAGASPIQRIFVRSDTIGTQRTLNVGTLSADDCDFRDIAITGTAAGSSPTRAGDCGGNSGITFPAGKTVYWNLAGTQVWSATAWASSSGGTPDANNFPLAQDTAVFDNTGAAGTVTFNSSISWNVGTINMSSRTSAMTLTNSGTGPQIYGDWTFGTGITYSDSQTLFFTGRGIQTITSNGVAFGGSLRVESLGTVQLADSLTCISSLSRLFTLASGTFDAAGYNVTFPLFTSNSTLNRVLKMGSGTWTLSGTGIVWDMTTTTGLGFYKGTADIVLSSTSTTARTFEGGSLSYNKLTIGGTTGTSTLTINGNNQFTELASTKTVAHTIALGTTTQTFGKWTVTGTLGNVVTLTGTGTSHVLAGACTSGIDYLAMGSIGFAATSPGEFYAGANSTGTAAAPVYRTAKPADSTRYWVGGTGNWSSTARWSTGSGGAGGASVPRSHDDVVFDSASNATAYTATVDAVTGGIRMKSLTIAGPASGNVTLAGSTSMDGIHGNVTLPATGLTRTYSGTITLSGSSSGKTITTNGVALNNGITVNGVDCGWTLAGAFNQGTSTLEITNGSFDTAGYALTAGNFTSNNANSRSIILGASTLTFSGTVLNFGTTETNRANLTVTAGTSQVTVTNTTPTFSGNNQTFYNVTISATGTGTATINGDNTFNNLSFGSVSTNNFRQLSLSGNQTINGTLTLPAGSTLGTSARGRTFVRSNTIGTTRTLTCAAVSMADVDFRDITIAGAAAPASGSRTGDCKGNSGITFTPAGTRYWNLAGGGNWSTDAWAATSGGTTDPGFFPLAQDTCIFEATGLNSGATVTINQSYNIGTIDMSARTTNTMTLAVSQQPTIYGNWINGTGVTISGGNPLTFSGRGSQTITNAGVVFTTPFTIDTPGGSVTLQDAFSSNRSSSDAINFTNGTFDAATYNVTLSGAAASVLSNNSNVRTIAIGSGTWIIAGSSNAWNTSTSTNLTVTGTGTISLTSASAKTFAGGSVDYSGITLNQGGNGTLTITGNNTFKTISRTASGANTINMGTTTQRITTSWTASGSAGNILTVQGSSASSPCTLVFTGSGQAASVDYLTITGIRAYNLDSTWYAGANSTNNGSLGWIFAAPGGTVFNVSFSDTATGADSVAVAASTFNVAFSDTASGLDALTTTATLNVDFSDTATGTDAVAGGLLLSVAFSDTATGADAISASATLNVAFADTATGADALAATATLDAAFADAASGADVLSVSAAFNVSLSETASGADELSATATLNVDFSDTATGLDAFAVAASTFNVSLSETATGLDEVSPAGSTFNVSLSDAGTITDLVAGNYLWNPIDDTQSANWQNVVTAQTPAWTDIVNTQGPNWVEIQT